MAGKQASMTLIEKATLTAGRDMWSTWALPQYDLASLRMADGPMGVTGGRVDERDIALLTPCGLALAASWDADLVRRVGKVIGDEALRMGVQAMLAPNLNLMRSPLAGRAFELFGEDPHLICELGSAWISGVQSKGVAAVAKHLVCNDSETDRRTMNARVDEATLREVYFRPFEHAATHGAWAMLTAYNRVNGVACAEQGAVIRGWLKDELKWDGLVMSDWFGTQNGPASLAAGLDLEMPGPARHMGSTLLDQASDQAHLDDAVARLMRLGQRVSRPAPYAADEGAQVRRLQVLEEAAAAGMVLLRNEGSLLPLTVRPDTTVAIIGPNAQVPCYQGGTFAKVALSSQALSPAEAITKRLQGGGATVLHAQGVSADYRIPPLTDLPLKTPAGEPGMLVRFEPDGTQSAAVQEVRRASSLIWFKDMPGVGNLLALDGQAWVKVRTGFTAERTGDHVFYLGGTGQASLAINGELLLSFDGMSVDADIMGKLMQAPHGHAACWLEAGAQVNLEFDMCIGRSLAHGIWFGCRPPERIDLLEQAVQAAAQADTAVLIVGETADAGLESVDRSTTCLPEAQVQLIERVCQVNKNTIVVLNVAHPVDTQCLTDAAAVLLAWYPGQEFGPALAAVLAGDREPGGRLPVTLARDETDYPVWSLTPDAQGDLHYHEQWWVGYRNFVARDQHPAFGFGYGQGYARFEYDGIALRVDNDVVHVDVTLRNVSLRAGKEVVQLYLQEPQAPGEPLRVSLKAFQAIHLQPGAVGEVRLQLDRKAFSRWSVDGAQWQMVPGVYSVQVGHALEDIVRRGQVEVTEQGELSVF